MTWSAPRTWTTGELVTAAHLNQEIRDNLLAALPLGPDGWPSYTPTLVQSGAVTKTVTYAKYTKVGRQVTAALVLAATGAGTGANTVQIGLPPPVPASSSAGVLGTPCGAGYLYDNSANLAYPGVACITSTTTFAFEPAAVDVAPGFLGGSTFTAALAAADQVAAFLSYESTT